MGKIFTFLFLILSLTLSLTVFAKRYDGAEAEKIMSEGTFVPVNHQVCRVSC